MKNFEEVCPHCGSSEFSLRGFNDYIGCVTLDYECMKCDEEFSVSYSGGMIFDE